jgi:branched-chain amino acid transport system permease protein
LSLTSLLGGRSFVALVFFVLAAVPVVANPYFVFVSNLVIIYVILAIGLNILVGNTGQLAFANAAMWGIGAYTCGLLRLRLGVPFYLALPAGALVATLVGTAITLPALRLRGLYLALVTIAFAESVRWTFIHWDAVTFGAGGFHIPPVQFAPLPLSAPTGIYYLSWLSAIAGVVFASRVLSSRIGRALVAIRDSDIAAASLGIDVFRFKALAFAVSGFYAGFAGGLYSAVLDYVAPENYDLLQMVLQKAMIVVGGLGSVFGSVLGATLLVVLYEVTRGFQSLEEITFGGLLVIFVIFVPFGIVSIFQRWLPGWSEHLSATSNPDRGMISAPGLFARPLKQPASDPR